MDPATAALSEEAVPAMAMLATSSQTARQPVDSPWVSLPTTITTRPPSSTSPSGLPSSSVPMMR